MQRREVLVLDDDPMIARALRRALADHHAVRCAATPSEALALIEVLVPDVLLGDYSLAEHTTAEFVREVKARWPSIRCILHSASPRAAWDNLLRDGILAAVVVKPASVAEILECIEAGTSPTRTSSE